MCATLVGWAPIVIFLCHLCASGIFFSIFLDIVVFDRATRSGA